MSENIGERKKDKYLDKVFSKEYFRFLLEFYKIFSSNPKKFSNYSLKEELKYITNILKINIRI